MFGADFLAAVTQVVMSSLGALARILNSKQALQIKHTLRELFIAAFMGIMLFFIFQSAGLETGWLFAASGVAGWLGPTVLDWITGLVSDKVGIKVPRVDKPPGDDGTVNTTQMGGGDNGDSN